MLIKENDSSQQCKKNEKKLKSLSGACSNNCCRQESLIDTQLMGIILNKSRKRFSPAPNICKGEKQAYGREFWKIQHSPRDERK